MVVQADRAGLKRISTASPVDIEPLLEHAGDDDGNEDDPLNRCMTVRTENSIRSWGTEIVDSIIHILGLSVETSELVVSWTRIPATGSLGFYVGVPTAVSFLVYLIAHETLFSAEC
jgi:hypothetical protein